MTFRTGKVIEMTGTSKVTILKWIHSGRLDPSPQKDERNGYYIWTEQDIQRLMELVRQSRSVRRKESRR